MVTDGEQTYCGDNFIMYINIESLCYIPETNIIFHQLFFNLKKMVEVQGILLCTDTTVISI